MNIVFDNIIFTLQQTGGISTVWSELLRRAATDRSIKAVCIDYRNDNVMRCGLATPPSISLRKRLLERYRLPAYRLTEQSVFHSSYFRVLPGAVNITTVHDLTYHYYRSVATKAVHLWEEARALRHSAGIICVSEHTRRDLLSCYPQLDEKRVRVIYNGVDERFRRLTDEEQGELPFERGSYALYVGNRQAEYKNYRVAVEAARRAGLPLVVAGNGLSEREQVYLEAQLGNGWAVVPNATAEELNQLYNGAFALLYPSDYEGFGLPVVEAQRAGCPVIAQESSSIPEAGGEGYLPVEPADRETLAEEFSRWLLALKSGQTDRRALTERGMRNAERFSWDKTYRETIGFYQATEAMHG